MILGKHIFLRPFSKSDIARSHHWLSKPELGSIMGYLPFPIDAQEEWFKTTINSRTKYIFAICDAKSDEHIGNIAIGNVDHVSRNGMLSLFLAESSQRGKGFGEEATRLILDFAFDRLNLHKVYLQASHTSSAAIALYQKVGFVKEGCMREHQFQEGRFVDKILFGLLRDEYQTSPT